MQERAQIQRARLQLLLCFNSQLKARNASSGRVVDSTYAFKVTLHGFKCGCKSECSSLVNGAMFIVMFLSGSS